MKGPKDYDDTQGFQYEDSQAHSYMDLPVLLFLVGQPWDELALKLVSTLRPSRLRVNGGTWTCDSCPWRVSVIIDKNNIIKNIYQEVKVAVDPHNLDETGAAIDRQLYDRGIKLQ